MIRSKRQWVGLGLILAFSSACSDQVRFSSGPLASSKQNQCVGASCASIPTSEIFSVPKKTGKVDVLLILDTTPAMFITVQRLGKHFANLIDSLSNSDYQVAVTNAAVDSYDKGLGLVTPGQLMSMYTFGTGRQDPLYILSPSVDYGDYILDQSINFDGATWPSAPGQGSFVTMRPYATVGPAQPMGSLITMMKNRGAGPNGTFFRDGAELVPVIVSAQDEGGGQADVQASDVVNAFHQYLGSMAGMQVYNFIVKAGDSACLNQYSSIFNLGSGGQYGVMIDQLAQATGGKSFSICDSDFTKDLSPVTQGFGPSIKSETLQHTPVASSVRVVSSTGASLDFTLNGNVVNFSQPLPANSSVTIYYSYQQLVQ